MEILLFSGNGYHRTTKGLDHVMDESIESGDTFPIVRKKMAEYVRSHAAKNVPIENMLYDDMKNYLSDNPEEFLLIENSEYQNIIFMGNKTNNGFLRSGEFSLVEVDTTRRWCIRLHAGVEELHYLEEPECMDEENNFYVEK